MTEESRARVQFYNFVTRVPHRAYGNIVPLIRDGFERDPDFVSRACAYIATGGSKIRDQQDSAIIALLQSPAEFVELRDAGAIFLVGNDVYPSDPSGYAGLPPWRVGRVDEHMRSPFSIRDGAVEVGRAPTLRAAQKKAGRIAHAKKVDATKYRIDRDASHSLASRRMRTIAGDYLRVLEENHARFDGALLHGGRGWLTDMYRFRHIKPGQRAQAILFDNDPPEDSKMYIVKQIAAETDVRKKIAMIGEHKIPYVMATSLLPKTEPAVLITLIAQMSPTEALNSRAWIERSGVLNIPEVKNAYLAKVRQATASVASAEHRRSAQGADADVSAAVSTAKDRAVAAERKIERRTLVLVDKSGSMQKAIEVAKRFATRIVPICVGELMCVAFDSTARPVDISKVEKLSDAVAAFKYIRADGQTSIEAGLRHALGKGFVPEQVVIITDGGENMGRYVRTLESMDQTYGQVPNTIVIGIPTSWQRNILAERIRMAGHPLEYLEYRGDYYLFDQVAALLGGPPALSIVDRILATPIPVMVK
jgi:hypothetical protein